MDNELTNNKSEIIQLYKAEFNDVADEFCIKLGRNSLGPYKATPMTQSTILNLLKKLIVYKDIIEKKEI